MLVNLLPEYEKNLSSAFNEKDFEALGEQAHKLKGATLYCATPRLTEAAKALENVVRNNEQSLDLLYHHLIKEIVAVKEEFNLLNSINENQI